MKTMGFASICLFLCCSMAIAASSMDSVTVFSVKIAYVTDDRLPKYVRIDAEIFSDAKSDLSGSWNTKYDEGWLELKPNGLATITTYLYDKGLDDTTAQSIDIHWTSPEKDQTGTLKLPFNWNRVERRNRGMQDEWYCGEPYGSESGDGPFTKVFIPIPCKVAVLGIDPLYQPLDTLFKRNYFRGFAEIPWKLTKPASGTYIYRTIVNGKALEDRKYGWPPRVKGGYYYGE